MARQLQGWHLNKRTQLTKFGDILLTQQYFKDLCFFEVNNRFDSEFISPIASIFIGQSRVLLLKLLTPDIDLLSRLNFSWFRHKFELLSAEYRLHRTLCYKQKVEHPIMLTHA